MQEKIKNQITEILKNLNIEDSNFAVLHPEDLKNGDYSTNVALISFRSVAQSGKARIWKTTHELAEVIKKELEKDLLKEIEKVEIAGPGFINFYLSREFFEDSVENILKQKENWGKNKLLKSKKIMVEYTDPNPFKPFHIGHLMTNAIGESISRIVEFSGAKTVRANYQGDIGPHVAKAIWGINHVDKLGKLNIYFNNDPSKTIEVKRPLEKESVSENAQYIGYCYHIGSEAYDTDENIKKEIESINKQIYNYFNKNGECDEKIKKYYDWGRKVTLEAFEEIYKILGTKFDYYFFESDMAVKGEKVVRDSVGKVFDESDGAVIFHGENYDKKLHTRVFINSQGLPTYETKEIGLTMTKFEKENPDLSIVVTATEQAEYMKVVQKAISLIHPDYEKRMKHITHGMMKFASGKMSSRKGNVVTGESLLRDSMDVVYEKLKDRDLEESEKKKIAEIVGVSALKYSILKSSLGSDIVYDFEKSISFEGDSGPYLQYTAVRANSILEKSKEFKIEGKGEAPEEIIGLEKLIYQFPEVIEHSYETLEPHHLATYLTELASAFNTFYGNTKILETGNKYMSYQLELVKAFYQTMKNGLWLLGIKTPDKM